jgi:hypothetical protein
MRLSAVLLLALVAVPFTAQADTLARFSGDNNGRTPVFEPGGPWMLYWYTKSDNTLPKTFEMRLYDADSGEYLGTVIQQRIIANGKKLFEDAGRYRVDVVAGNLDWTLVVSEVVEDEAADPREQWAADDRGLGTALRDPGCGRRLRVMATRRRPDAVAICRRRVAGIPGHVRRPVQGP